MTRVDEYLDRAGESERMAERVADPSTRQQLLEIAAAWRALAAYTGRHGRPSDIVVTPTDPEG